jgi:hypothetical protein
MQRVTIWAVLVVMDGQYTRYIHVQGPVKVLEIQIQMVIVQPCPGSVVRAHFLILTSKGPREGLDIFDEVSSGGFCL